MNTHYTMIKDILLNRHELPKYIPEKFGLPMFTLTEDVLWTVIDDIQKPDVAPNTLQLISKLNTYLIGKKGKQLQSRLYMASTK